MDQILENCKPGNFRIDLLLTKTGVLMLEEWETIIEEQRNDQLLKRKDMYQSFSDTESCF